MPSYVFVETPDSSLCFMLFLVERYGTRNKHSNMHTIVNYDKLLKEKNPKFLINELLDDKKYHSKSPNCDNI